MGEAVDLDTFKLGERERGLELDENSQGLINLVFVGPQIRHAWHKSCMHVYEKKN